MHNDLQTQIAFNGGKPDFMDTEEEKAMHKASLNNDDANIDARAILENSIKNKIMDKQIDGEPRINR